jgi:hypothetical protein
MHVVRGEAERPAVIVMSPQHQGLATSCRAISGSPECATCDVGDSVDTLWAGDWPTVETIEA